MTLSKTMLCYYADCHYAECRILLLITIMLNVVMLSVAFYYYYAECWYAECRCAECFYAECCYAECCYAEWLSTFITSLELNAFFKQASFLINLVCFRKIKSISVISKHIEIINILQ
jgi:hypothetical protein